MNKIKDFSESVIHLYSCLNKIDINEAYLLFNNLIKYHSKKKKEKENYKPVLDIENEWYNSLNNGMADYSVYGCRYYFIDLMVCYWVYSRNYISMLNKKVFDGKTKTISEKFANVKSVLDLGCGLGYTTKDLINTFPSAKIYASNIENTPQWNHCLEVLEDNVTLINENDMVKSHIDLVFASEFFEHIENPIEYIDKIIKNNSPKIFIIANSFNTKSIGHFNNYKDTDRLIHGKDISRVFNKRLKSFGYSKETTSIWNDKPSIWVKNEP